MLPPVQWTEGEVQHGAVGFEQHLHLLMANRTSSTASLSSTTMPTPLQRLNHVVATIMPQVVEAIQHEFVNTSISTGVVTTTTPTTTDVSRISTTPTTITSTPATVNTLPPTVCIPTSNVQVKNIFLKPFIVA
jgi:hypothetical protein